MSEFGAVFFRGPSLLTGDPIVGVITGLERGSMNAKTGRIAQTWILRADKHPMDAVRDRSDDAICGDCKLRGDGARNRKCYVTPFFGPNQVFKHVPTYPDVTWSELAALLEGRYVRLGAYGDPAAIGFEVWQQLLSTAAGWVGYTHQHTRCDPRFKSILMASVDTVDEAITAGLRGWRTFRVRLEHEPLIAGAEFICPASDEAGHRITCADCQLCRGTSSPARSVAIIAHGKPSVMKAYGVKVDFFNNRRHAEARA